MNGDNRLFVTDEEDGIEDDVEEKLGPVDTEVTEKELEEDVVIQEFPLNITGRDEILQIFQYANKPKKVGKKPADHPFIGATRYKSNSSVWELDIPLNESAFYNKERAEDNWSQANIQTLRGVGVENKGQYAGFVSDGQIYLLPVDKITQLRPYFKYIDNASQQRKQEDAKRNISPASQKTQVITMSVKSVNDPTQHRLGGALLAHKVAEEEEAVELNWVENTFEQFKDSMIAESSSHILRAVGDQEDYEANLL